MDSTLDALTCSSVSDLRPCLDIHGVPTVWLGLLQYLEEGEGHRKLGFLKAVVIGGAAAPRAVVEKFEQVYQVEVRVWIVALKGLGLGLGLGRVMVRVRLGPNRYFLSECVDWLKGVCVCVWIVRPSAESRGSPDARDCMNVARTQPPARPSERARRPQTADFGVVFHLLERMLTERRRRRRRLVV